MYYYKYMKDESVISLLTFERNPRPTEGLVEITQEEYNEILAKITANAPKEDPSSSPTYEELMEAYTILTGGEEIE